MAFDETSKSKSDDNEQDKAQIPGYLNSSGSDLERLIKNPEGDSFKINKRKALEWLRNAKLKVYDVTLNNYATTYPNPYGYDQESVQADGEYAKNLKSKIDKDNAESYDSAQKLEQQELSDLWETILYFNLSKWLNDEVDVFPGSDFDDYKNKVDLVIQTKNTDQCISVDAATGHDMQSKVDYINALYKTQDRLNRVKYHLEKNGQIKFRNVPHLILGLSKNKITAITAEWIKTGEIDPKYQKTILMEMHMQLSAYAEYFTGNPNGKEKAEQIEKFLPVVEKALEKLPPETLIPYDETYEQIHAFVKSEFPTAAPSPFDYAMAEEKNPNENSSTSISPIIKHPTRPIKVIKKSKDIPETASGASA